ncbi:flagellar biosynthesis protein FlgB [Sphingomonas melonis]|jgi:flagellar basal-body rod protein FlgB|uniref:Flagellar basal-body rod protein FlgB n=1 Tax=Sphingomonas melonis TaxID=152682 RepID=A0A7Y9FRZ6_9SPHN|nr:flagellar biosynthesis protein FlgB [Sphingomonas melonis]NYD92113.1 flagellar basal-body rod protein FlgB [Sphingomonas melonis]
MSDPIPLIDGLTRSMKHLAERQRVVAQNIANSETPAFRAQDVEAPDFSSLLTHKGVPHVARPRVSATTGMVALGVPATTGGQIIADSNVTETKPDGNNVTLEDQLLKMGQIQADFQTMTDLYRKQMGLIQMAIGR